MFWKQHHFLFYIFTWLEWYPKQEKLPSSEVIIADWELNTTRTNGTFQVDSSVSVLRIEISKVSSQREIIFTKPDGKYEGHLESNAHASI